MSIRNTSTDPISPFLILLDGLSGGDGTGAIEEMEKRGQTELVNSDRLPTDANNGDRESADDRYLALGFTFGEPDEHDPLFRPATLPPGWKREASDHSMWSHIVDELGRRRVSVFYKAASYDRRAFMRLDTPSTYFYSVMHAKGEPVLDASWLTVEVAVKELTALRDSELKYAAESDRLAAEKPADYWREQSAEQRANAAWCEAQISKLTEPDEGEPDEDDETEDERNPAAEPVSIDQ